MTPQALTKAKETWAGAIIRTARKDHRCDWGRCLRTIATGETYIDPGECNPDRANGYGGYRFHLTHFED